MGKEALDSVKDERPFAGVHILATALLCATGSSSDELELARRILERDPKRDAPRESESVAGAFNRHMDAAIDSLNDSAHEPLRVGRRARLAADLDRAGLVLVDRAAIASLIATVAELRAELARVDGEDLGAELVDDDLAPGAVIYDAIDDRGQLKPDVSDRYGKLPSHYFPRAVGGPIGGSFVDGNGGSYCGLEFMGGDRDVELNPSVND